MWLWSQAGEEIDSGVSLRVFARSERNGLGSGIEFRLVDCFFFPAPITATQRYRQPTVTVPRETLHRSANDVAKEATNVCPRKQLISAHHVGIDPVIQTWNTIIEKEEDNVDWLDFSQRDCRVLFVCSASF